MGLHIVNANTSGSLWSEASVAEAEPGLGVRTLRSTLCRSGCKRRRMGTPSFDLSSFSAHSMLFASTSVAKRPAVLRVANQRVYAQRTGADVQPDDARPARNCAVRWSSEEIRNGVKVVGTTLRRVQVREHGRRKMMRGACGDATKSSTHTGA